MRKFSLIGIAMLIVSIPTFAGGILTNTNQHVSFLRMLARGASIDIDGVYSNPAGLAFLPEDGLYLSLNGQSAYPVSYTHLSGVGAKELVVSTLGVLYADDAEADAVSLGERIPITPLVAFGYMVFVLIYFPCIATLAAIKGESGLSLIHIFFTVTRERFCFSPLRSSFSLSAATFLVAPAIACSSSIL